jgi:SAM-dependent methyltransferase
MHVPPDSPLKLPAAVFSRAADPQLRAMLAAYLSDAALPAEARVLEVGCGTGAVTRSIAAWPGVSAAVGLDPSPVFVARARELASNLPSVTFPYLSLIARKSA